MDELTRESTANAISDALYRLGDATGVVLAVALKNGTIRTFLGGDLVVKMGLVEALQNRVVEEWDSADELSDEEALGE